MNGSQATEIDSGTGIQVLYDSAPFHLTCHVPAVHSRSLSNLSCGEACAVETRTEAGIRRETLGYR